MTPEQLAEAKRYGRISLRASLADMGLDLAFLGVFSLFAAAPLDAALRGAGRWGEVASLRLLAFYLVMTAAHICVSLPLSFYAGFVVERRFGLSTLTLAGWAWRYCKRMALAVAFGAPMTLGLYWLIWTTQGYWWLAAAGCFFVVGIVVGKLVPVLILPLFYKIEPLDDAALIGRLSALAEGTGMRVSGVYRIGLSAETVKANAMLAGLGRTRRILLGDTLLTNFTADEIAVIFAHEIGHHVCRHMPKLIVLGLAASTAGFWTCDWALRQIAPGGAPSYANFPIAALPALTLCLTVFSFLIGPALNAISRRFERQADRYALRQTGLRDAYRTAFARLARLNKDDPAPHWLEVVLFHSHPPIAERLAMADKDAT